LTIGVSFYLAKSREQAIREMRPYYEEHIKMFAPLGFVPGITPAQIEAVARRGGRRHSLLIYEELRRALFPGSSTSTCRRL
jgi:hypothetical protein